METLELVKDWWLTWCWEWGQPPSEGKQIYVTWRIAALVGAVAFFVCLCVKCLWDSEEEFCPKQALGASFICGAVTTLGVGFGPILLPVLAVVFLVAGTMSGLRTLRKWIVGGATIRYEQPPKPDVD